MVWKFGKKKSVVAIVKLDGVIGKVGKFSSGINLDNTKFIEKAFKVPNVTAVAILVNSPGGSPVQSEMLFKRIRNLAKDEQVKKKNNKPIPVFTFCEDVAASGGYFLACSGDEIYASNSSIIGSIGVISAGFGFVDALKKLGIERRVFSQGDNKSSLDPFQPSKTEDIKTLTDAQRDVHDEFKNIVKSSRGKKLTASDKELFNGKFWSGKQALELGLIDGIGFYEDVLRKKYGKEVKFKLIETQKGFLQRKLSAKHEGIVNLVKSQISELAIWNKYGL